MNQKNAIKLMAGSALIQYLASVQSATKADILNHAVEYYRFETGIETPDNDRERIRSQIGSELKDFTKCKFIRSNDGYFYLSRQPKPNLPEEEPYPSWIRDLKESYSAEEMIPLIERHCGGDGNAKNVLYYFMPDGLPISLNLVYIGELPEQPPASPGEAKSRKAVKTTLQPVKKANEVKRTEPKTRMKDPVDPFAGLEGEARMEAEYLSMLHKKGGMFFERFVAGLLVKKLLASGLDVIDYCVIGGNDDGGIDVVIDTMDQMGFCDHIVVQAKCHGKASVTENTIRDFYGSMKMQNGTRGIFITTTSFTSSAQNLLNVLNNCIGVDGATIYQWAKELSYGVHVAKGKCFLDPVILG